MENRIQQRLSSATSKDSINKDVYFKINVDGEQRLLPPDEINHIVDVNKRFEYERSNSTFYRVYGTIKPLMSNVLFNLSGASSWSSFTTPEFIIDPKNLEYDLTYTESIQKHLKEIDGWFGYNDPNSLSKGLCGYIDMEPKRDRFSFIPDNTNNLIKNWDITITYPYSADTTHQTILNGLLMIEKVSVSVGDVDMVALAVPYKHNLENGSMVMISGTNKDGYYEVKRLGLDDGSSMDYYFCINLPSSAITISNNSRMKRVVANEPSSYYIRKFKKIKTRVNATIENDDYDIFKIGFSKNIFSDDISQFIFNQDIDTSNLTDNLGRPLSEIYLTLIKTDSNSIFTKVSSGIETPFIPTLNTSNINPFLQNIPVIQKIHNGGSLPFTSHKSLEDNVTINDNDFYGDVVEYNRYEVKETILADVYYRFNTVNRETASNLNYVVTSEPSNVYKTISLGPRQEGYYYKAHHQIKLKSFSSFIEQGDNLTENIPSYAENLGDGRYLWRDLLDVGINQTPDTFLDYPFLNGCHYRYQDYCFSVKRQDPFGSWGLYYNKFPADKIGEQMPNDFIVKKQDYVC